MRCLPRARILIGFLLLSLAWPKSAAAHMQQSGSITLPTEGAAVLRVGDINGDEFLDLVVLVGSIGGQAGQALLLYLGSSTGLPPIPTNTVVLQPPSKTPRSLAVADVSGDGLDDVIVGDPDADVGAPSAGAVFVFRGSAAPPFLPPTPTSTISPTQARQAGAFGWSIAVGNVFGTANRDVIVGDPSSGVLLGPGRVVVYAGPIPPGVVKPGVVRAREIFGQQVDDGFGYVVTAANVLGGKRQEVIVGSPFFDGVFFGSETGRVDIFSFPGATPLVTLTDPCPQLNGAFGYFLVAGDIDGNGFADLAIGNRHSVIRCVPFENAVPNRVHVFFSSGMTIGPTPATILTVPGELNIAAEQQLAVADITPEGAGELIIGAPASDAGAAGDTGKVFIFVGTASPPGVSLLQVLVSPNLRDFDNFGFAVAAGDTTNSGLDELLALSPNNFLPDEVFIFNSTH